MAVQRKELSYRVIHGNALDVLARLPDASVDCIVSSPPYFALRSYGVLPTIWGGDSGCEHEFDNDVCKKCGAWRGCLGLEPHFDLYIANLMAIFDEARRVLKPTGTCWVNIGDTFNSHTTTEEWARNINNKKFKDGVWRDPGRDSYFLANAEARSKAYPGKPPLNRYPDKCLFGIPFRFALAMLEHGWVLRNTIIWHKSTPRPESVKDRFSVDFEYVFFFVVQSKGYYFEQQLIPLKTSSLKRAEHTFSSEKSEFYGGLSMKKLRKWGEKVRNGELKGANMRCVWTVPTEPFHDAHFATFPKKLIEVPIRAGCPVHGVVLDPFAGSGTVGVVAAMQNKSAILVEANADYCKIIKQRLLDEAKLHTHDMLVERRLVCEGFE